MKINCQYLLGDIHDINICKITKGKCTYPICQNLGDSDVK